MNDHLVDHGFLTAKDRRANQLDDRYDHFYAEIADELESKHEADMPDVPYKVNFAQIHRETLARMAEIEAE